MRKGLIALTSLALVAGAIYALWPREEAPAPSEQASAEAAAVGEPAPGRRAVLGPARDTGRPSGTPALKKLATWADGTLLVEVTAEGAPKAGAQVRLYWRGARDPNTNSFDWRLAGEALTDESGSAKLPAAPGSYLVVARASAFSPSRQEVVRPQGEAVTRTALALRSGSALSGHTVEKKGGAPVPLVELALTPQAPGAVGRRASAPTEEVATASSDARGAFQFEGLAPGRYALQARAPGHSLQEQTVLVSSGLTSTEVLLGVAGVIEGFVRRSDGSPAGGAEVSVIGPTDAPLSATAGPEGGFSVEVSAGRWQLSARWQDQTGWLDSVVVSAGGTTRGVEVRLGAGSTVEGAIRDRASAAAVAGARVDLSPHGFTGDCGRAVSDPDGGFRVGGLAPGAYDVVVNAEGYSEKIEQANVLAGQTFALTAELDANSALEGTVRDTGGHSLAGAWVLAGTLEAKTDDDGHYRVAGVPTGTLWVTARKAAERPGAGQRVEIRPGETAHADFQLADNGYFKGRVRRPGSASLSGRPVMVSCVPHTQGLEFATLPADSDGNFEQELAPGAFSCWAAYADTPGQRGPTLQVTIELGHTATAELLLSEGDVDGGVWGTVLEPDGTPSPGALVRVRMGPGGGSTATTDDEGRFALMLSPVPAPASVNIFVRNGGRMLDETLDHLAAQLELRLKAAGTLRGHLVPKDGNPVSGFTVDVAFKVMQGSRGGGSLTGTRPFTGDTFQLTDLPADALVVNVSTSDGRAGRAEVTTSPGTVTEVELPLDPAAIVHGRVLGVPPGTPLAGVRVVIDDNWVSRDWRTGLDGTFSVALVAGPHKLQWLAADWVPQVRRVSAQPGQQVELGDISLASARVPSSRAP